MGALNVEIPDELEKRFRIEIAKRYDGMKKGDLAKAVIEAIELWIKAK
jgi:hypothetical protein